MKILRICAQGLPLFREKLVIDFYAQQRVAEENKACLYQICQKPSIYTHTANAFIGINASGKTSVLKVIQLALSLINNEPINHVEAKTILGGADGAVFQIYFADSNHQICRLETEITSRKTRAGGFVYSIVNEKLWEKNIRSIPSRKALLDFGSMEPAAIRNENEVFLSDDVSFIIAHNKQTGDRIDICSLLSFTNVNVLPFTEDIPLDITAYLDPTIEKLYFSKEENKSFIHLKFYGDDEIILNNAADLEQYLSSGTIKGIITFSMAKEVLKNGGYLIIDEIENHFNKEIVMTLLHFFMDSSINKNGGTLIFSTHYPELLDAYDRNDGISIVRNQNGITVDNLSSILSRNDIKKSDAYQSGLLGGTAPAYNTYIRLKKSFAASIR